MEMKNSIKDINTEKIRAYMRKNDQASKSEIARDTNLSFPTVTRLLDHLCSAGEIEEIGMCNETGGRSAAVYSMNPAFSLSLMIRLEGHRINWMIKNLTEQILASDEIIFETGILNELDEIIRSLRITYPQIKVCVIGIAAMVTDGVITQTTEYQELKGVNLAVHFENRADIPVVVENDMNVLIMGQWHRRKVKPKASVCIHYGESGPGAGLQIEGKMWRGTSNFAGELFYLLPKERPDARQMVEYYIKLIQIYSVILNPDQIILYENGDLKPIMNEIRQGCYELLPENAVPYIELSDDFKVDYECGLFAIAQSMLE